MNQATKFMSRNFPAVSRRREIETVFHCILLLVVIVSSYYALEGAEKYGMAMKANRKQKKGENKPRGEADAVTSLTTRVLPATGSAFSSYP
jgi:hypothetical protein